ncbi:ATP-binding protein [Dyadobacter frigoris]|uniref:ATP-binding protein n=1 Tax=Dyadobacter frigoris TaxID=2576211 RepID=A0A4U6CMJ3_9BACT|nr:DUF87 domain-containing protein [Dyadobacter frigoris]TKT85256.1 ATP-binding protein [Dyadobacter frigoris]
MEHLINIQANCQVWENLSNFPSRTSARGIEAIGAVRILPLQFDTTNHNLGEMYMKQVRAAELNNIMAIMNYLNDITDHYVLEMQSSKVQNNGISMYLIIKIFFKYTPNKSQITAVFEGIDQLLIHFPHSHVTADEIKIITDRRFTHATEVIRKVKMIETGHFGGLYKTNAVIPQLDSFRLNSKISPVNGKIEFHPTSRGYYNELNYQIPVSETVKSTQEFSLATHVILGQTDGDTVIRYVFTSAEIFPYDKAYISNFHELLSDTYQRNTSVKNEMTVNYLSVYINIMNGIKLPAMQIFIQSDHESNTVLLSNTLVSEIGSNRFEVRPVMHISELHAGQFFASPYDLIHEQASPILERMQYLYSLDEINSIFPAPLIDSKFGFIPMITKKFKPFSRSFEDCKKGGIPLGTTLTDFGNGLDQPFEIPIENLLNHMILTGTTGSGKSTTMGVILNSLLKENVNCLVVEPVKSEYKNTFIKSAQQLGKTVHFFQVETPFIGNTIDASFLRINPLIPYPGISLEQHLSYIHAAITAAFPFYGLTGQVLFDVMYDLFKLTQFKDPMDARIRKGMGLKEKHYFDPQHAPHFFIKKYNSINELITVNNDQITLKTLLGSLPEYFAQNSHQYDPKMAEEMQGALARRLSFMTKGTLGHILSPELWRMGKQGDSNIPNNIENILNENAIIDLHGIPGNEGKALIMSLIFTYLYEARMLRKSHGNDPMHVTVLEESHRFLSANGTQSHATGDHSHALNSTGKFIELFQQSMAEFRAKREGLVIIEQSVSKIIPDIIKFTSTKVMHTVKSYDDRGIMGRAMNLDAGQTQYALHLNPGEAIVLTNGLSNAQLIKVNNLNQ